MTSRSAGLAAILALCVGTLATRPAAAQKPPDPEVGYVFPPGGARGTTVVVQLAGFDWTPDLQFFVLDPRVTLVVDGPLSRHLMPEPPLPIGIRAYRPPFIPREVAARIVLPADLPPGPIRWQVANANGASSTGVFIVGDGNEVVEQPDPHGPQTLDALPITVSGRLSRWEEVDTYVVEPARTGPVTCELAAQRLGSNINGVMEIRDSDNRVIADAVDSAGNDLALTFAGEAGRRYRVCVRDLNFRGNRAFVYRLSISEGPRVLAVLPAVGQRGRSQQVELVGYGLASGRCAIEKVTRTIAFPEDPRQESFAYRLETGAGTAASFVFPLSDVPEMVESDVVPAESGPHAVPFAATGTLARGAPEDRYRVSGKSGDIWNISVESRRYDSPLDVAVAVVGADGKELVSNDDLPGTTDAGLEFTVPAEGAYDVVVRDVSGAHSSPLNLYRLVVRPAEPDFTLRVPQHVNVPVGEKVELVVRIDRTGGFSAPIALSADGLPEGITIPGELQVSAEKEFRIPLQSASDAPSGAVFVTITGTATIGNRTLRRTALAQGAGNLAPRAPEENLVQQVLLASTMKPVTKIRPIETDERTVHRGTMHLAELAIERLPGFGGEVIVQMDSRQPAKFRQGILGPDILVPPGSDRVFYPCQVPDAAETNDAYRILLEAVAQVPDARGQTRFLVSKMQADDASVALTVEGALLKVSSPAVDLTARGRGPLDIPVRVFRSAKLPADVRLEIRFPPELEGRIHSDPFVVPPGRHESSIAVRWDGPLAVSGKRHLTIRAVALQPSENLPALTDTAGATPMDRETLAILRAGALPVVAETEVVVEIAGGE